MRRNGRRRLLLERPKRQVATVRRRNRRIDPTGRISGGIPDLAAIGDYGDALQTVTEQIIAHTKLSRWNAIHVLR